MGRPAETGRDNRPGVSGTPPAVIESRERLSTSATEHRKATIMAHGFCGNVRVTEAWPCSVRTGPGTYRTHRKADRPTRAGGPGAGFGITPPAPGSFGAGGTSAGLTAAPGVADEADDEWAGGGLLQYLPNLPGIRVGRARGERVGGTGRVGVVALEHQEAAVVGVVHRESPQQEKK